MKVNCRGRLLDLDSPKVMGILNTTPDSFYDGGRYQLTGTIEERIDQIIAEGASIIDIGGMSSRPGADHIAPAEELDRILPAVEYALTKDIIVSVDTFQSQVAEEVLKKGVHMINDISGLQIEPDLLQILTKYRPAYVLMHMKGKPENMQDKPQYEDVVLDLLKFLAQKVSDLTSAGLTDILIDPGFGFGKSLVHNYTILRRLSSFKIFDHPILVGLSRKSMIHKVLACKSSESLTGTVALHMLALQNGANILRVHDIKDAVETVSLWNMYSSV